MMDRRMFLKIMALAPLGAAGGRLAAAGLEAVDAAELVPPGEPLRAGRWAMVVDIPKCLETPRCDRCIRACHEAHNVPAFDEKKYEVKWVWRETFEQVFPGQVHPYLRSDLKNASLLALCNHCQNPPCVRVCPTQATFQRPDGVVVMDDHRCIGCRYCMTACPYGSRSFNWTDPRPHLAKIEPGYPTRTKGVVEKCTFCAERLDQGKPPLCVATCPAKALAFGDLSDEASEVRKRLASRFALRRKQELGTQPMVFYLV